MVISVSSASSSERIASQPTFPSWPLMWVACLCNLAIVAAGDGVASGHGVQVPLNSSGAVGAPRIQAETLHHISTMVEDAPTTQKDGQSKRRPKLIRREVAWPSGSLAAIEQEEVTTQQVSLQPSAEVASLMNRSRRTLANTSHSVHVMATQTGRGSLRVSSDQQQYGEYRGRRSRNAFSRNASRAKRTNQTSPPQVAAESPTSAMLKEIEGLTTAAAAVARAAALVQPPLPMTPQATQQPPIEDPAPVSVASTQAAGQPPAAPAPIVASTQGAGQPSMAPMPAVAPQPLPIEPTIARSAPLAIATAPMPLTSAPPGSAQPSPIALVPLATAPNQAPPQPQVLATASTPPATWQHFQERPLATVGPPAEIKEFADTAAHKELADVEGTPSWLLALKAFALELTSAGAQSSQQGGTFSWIALLLGVVFMAVTLYHCLRQAPPPSSAPYNRDPNRVSRERSSRDRPPAKSIYAERRSIARSYSRMSSELRPGMEGDLSGLSDAPLDRKPSYSERRRLSRAMVNTPSTALMAPQESTRSRSPRPSDSQDNLRHSARQDHSATGQSTDDNSSGTPARRARQSYAERRAMNTATRRSQADSTGAVDSGSDPAKTP